MSIGPTLETDRLILRPPTADDVEPWVAFGADVEVAQFIGGAQTPAMVWRTMCAVAGAWTINGFSMFSVVEKARGRWIGRLGPWRPVGWPGPEVGWASRDLGPDTRRVAGPPVGVNLERYPSRPSDLAGITNAATNGKSVTAAKASA